MSTLSILTSTFAEICTLFGFFIFLGVIIIAIRWCYDYIINKSNNFRRNKQIKLNKIQADRANRIKIDELIAYYELQSEDAVQDVKPNADLLKACNWD